jgi:hypothetical protein
LPRCNTRIANVNEQATVAPTPTHAYVNPKEGRFLVVVFVFVLVVTHLRLILQALRVTTVFVVALSRRTSSTRSRAARAIDVGHTAHDAATVARTRDCTRRRARINAPHVYQDYVRPMTDV